MMLTREKYSPSAQNTVASGEVFADEAILIANSTAATNRDVWGLVGVRPGGGGDWRRSFASRINQLLLRTDGWDSYGGVRLQRDAVAVLQVVLSELDPYIGTAPAISLTTEGGLLCSWSNGSYSLDIEASATEEPSVYFRDNTSGFESDVPLTETRELEKLVWQASN